MTRNVVSINGEIVSSDAANVKAVTDGVLYGKGVFTTIRIVGREPFVWDKHWRRITGHAAKIGLDVSNIAEDELRRSIDETIAANEIIDGRCRVTFLDGLSRGPWQADAAGRTTNVVIMCGALRPPRDEVKIGLSTFPINSSSPLAGIKSCNYLENILALEKAKIRGFNEAVRLNERGEIVSGCMSNLFWAEGGDLYTPSLETGCLAGTTRELVMERLECSAVAAGLTSILNADAVFLNSAGLGVMRCSELDGRRLGGDTHEILKILPRTR